MTSFMPWVYIRPSGRGHRILFAPRGVPPPARSALATAHLERRQHELIDGQAVDVVTDRDDLGDGFVPEREVVVAGARAGGTRR